MLNVEYTSVDRILAKLSRELRGMDFNESDVIEQIGEALDALNVAPVMEQAVAFIEVDAYEAIFPRGLVTVLQMAKDQQYKPSDNMDECGCSVKEVIEQATDPVEETAACPIVTDCQGNLVGDYEYAYYRPAFDLKWEYELWTGSNYFRQFTPIRLANNSFFGTEVARSKRSYEYRTKDEYTIIKGNSRKFRFSFEKGRVAISYLRSVSDPETGYPLIPDQYSFISAITYYVKWKMAERYAWNGREGFARLAQDSERQWLKYVKQAKNYAKMPKGIDQHQNMLEASFQLIPNHRRYYNFFEDLGRPDPNRNPFEGHEPGYRGDTVVR